MLFACGEPITAEKLSQICNTDIAEIMAELERLKARYNSDEYGLTLLELAGAYQLATKPQHAPYIKAATEIKKQTPLSAAAMEVLAIIAYNQPVSKAFVEQVRGIDSSSVVNTLNERGLVEEAGRLDLPGRPLAYRTSENFLRCFGLKNLSELPPLPNPDGIEQLSLEEIEIEEDET